MNGVQKLMAEMAKTEAANAFEFASRYYPKGESIIVIKRAAKVALQMNRSLRARVARLEEALRRGVELHENCDADTCMCGDSMWHALSDHKPIATLQYYGDQWAEEARRALEEK